MAVRGADAKIHKPFIDSETTGPTVLKLVIQVPCGVRVGTVELDF